VNAEGTTPPGTTPQQTRPQAGTRRRGVPAALTRYRIIAYVVGVLLLVLVFVAMPLKYFAGIPGPVAVVGTGHGFLYCVYLLAAFDLALRARWTAKGTVLVLLAGTIPFLTFVAEHIVTRKTRAGERV
jgi:integral membrane protein